MRRRLPRIIPTIVDRAGWKNRRTSGNDCNRIFESVLAELDPEVIVEAVVHQGFRRPEQYRRTARLLVEEARDRRTKRLTARDAE